MISGSLTWGIAGCVLMRSARQRTFRDGNRVHEIVDAYERHLRTKRRRSPKPFPKISVEELTVGNDSPTQPGEISRCLDKRTLEVRGSIPLGSTRKRSRRVEIRGGFVFGAEANRSRSVLEGTRNPGTVHNRTRATLRAMSMDPAMLRDEALRLPTEARARLAAELLRSLDDAEEVDAAEHEATWNTEIAERLRQVDSGVVQAVPWNDARARITRED